MTILPKKKAEEESDSDSDHDHSAGCPDVPSPHDAAGHAPLSAPTSPEEVGCRSPEGFYHRRYDLSSSSGESSPELPSLSKRTSYRSSPAATASGTRGKKPLDTSPGYNSSEEYDGSRRPYVDPEGERQFENALRKERGLVIKKMRPDGACLFRAVADQVYGDQEMHAVVRNHCMDYMLKNADYFSQYISDEDFGHYINRKRMDQCYGNNVEMQAIAEMYNRPIEVYQYTTDPINIFFGVYKTDNAPIRLSYHGSIHYNSVVDPYKATVGVGLGLADHKPGYADKMLLVEAQRDSENVHIEQTMLEDKKRSTDWEATYDAIEEAVARESYLTWLRENEKRSLPPEKFAGSQPSSSACRGTSPPLSSTSYSSPAPQGGDSPTMTPTKKTSMGANYRSFTTAKMTEGKHVKSRTTHATNSSASNSSYHQHHRGGLRRFTPSPPSNAHHRGGSGSGNGGSTRNAPYHSPRDSPRCGGLRGMSRNSPPKDRNINVDMALRGVANSPTHGSPRNSVHSDALNQGVNHAHHSGSSSPELSPKGSGPQGVARKPLFINLNESPPGSSKSGDVTLRGEPLLNPHTTNPAPSPALRTLSPYQTSPTSPLAAPPSTPLHRHHHHHHQGVPLVTSPSLLGNSSSPHSGAPPATSGSQSPPHTLNFEDGRVLSQLPYEYSSFLDLPPAALGLSEWEDDRVLAAVLAASQQEYIDSLRCPRPPSSSSAGEERQ